MASFALRAALGAWSPGPWIFNDELRYWELGKGFAQTGHFELRGVRVHGYAQLYPVVLAPVYRIFHSLPTAYAAIKVLNAAVMSLVALPTYLLARSLVTARRARVAAALSLAVPAMFYTGTVMTENLFYPLFAASIWAMTRAVHKPGLKRELLALAAIGCAFLTRSQAIALIIALPTAIVVAGALRARDAEAANWRAFGRELKRFRATWLALACASLAVLALVALGHSPASPLGGYANVARTAPRLGLFAKLVVYHVSELDLSVGVAPFAALLVLLGRLFSRRRLPDPLLAFAAVGVSAVLWMTLIVAQAGAFYSVYDAGAKQMRIHERNLFHVVPIFFVALVLVTRRMEVQRRWLLAAAAIAAALPLFIPYGEMVNNSSVADTPGLALYGHYQGALFVAIPDARLLAGVLAFGLALAFLAPLRGSRLTPIVAVAVYLGLSSIPAALHAHSASNGAVTAVISGKRDWIDRANPRRQAVVALGMPGVDRHVVWENEFFNRSVGTVLNLCSTALHPELPDTIVRIAAEGALVDSRGRPVRALLALTPKSLPLRGAVVAADPRTGVRLVRPSAGRLVLARPRAEPCPS